MRKLSGKALIFLLMTFTLPGYSNIPGSHLIISPFPTDTLTSTDYEVIKVTLPVGRGALNERLTSFRVLISSSKKNLTRISIDLSETDQLSDITSIRVYYNGYKKQLNLNEATLFGSSTVGNDSKFSIAGNVALDPGTHYFWVNADISRKAKEGNQIEASATKYYLEGESSTSVPAAHGKRTIILTHQLLFSGGDWNSNNYRIPAIVTALDGSLITATDRRWNNPWDLPRHIDLVIRRSTDKGSSWSEPFTLAGLNDNTGFGDATLICNQANGEIICLFASGEGFLHSSDRNPIRTYQATSRDHGKSWSSPVEITSQIYGPSSDNLITQTWQGAFVSSGNATQLRSGRIIAALVVRETSKKDISNFIMYSDDRGRSWKVSTHQIVLHGNEAKVVEQNNGNLLISIRNKGYRIFAISTDQGMTWGTPYFHTDIIDPSCNGSLIRYTSLHSGFEKNRMLHSIPYSSERENLSILLSYDEGESWPIKKTIYPGKSAYSSLSILPDGSIGMYYEVGEYETYQLYFARFSLKWLTDGQDEWRPPIHYSNSNSIEYLQAETKTSLLIYPNPARDQVKIQGSWEESDHLQIFDACGRLMSTIIIQYPHEELSISVANYPAGIYWVKAKQAGSWLVVK